MLEITFLVILSLTFLLEIAVCDLEFYFLDIACLVILVGFSFLTWSFL